MILIRDITTLSAMSLWWLGCYVWGLCFKNVFQMVVSKRWTLFLFMFMVEIWIKNKYCFKKLLAAQQVPEDGTWLVDYVLHAWFNSLLDCLLNMMVSSDVDGLPECFLSVTHLVHWNLIYVQIFALVGNSFWNLYISLCTLLVTVCITMHWQ